MHGAVLLLFLTARETAPPKAASPAALAVFDIQPPPPAPTTSLRPPQPPEPRARHVSKAAFHEAGGSPSAAPSQRPTPVDATSSMLVSLRSSAMTSSFGDNDATALSLGQTGAGDGGGDGDAVGIGTGKGFGLGPPRYARAEWIHTPSFQEMLGYWPAGSRERRIGGSVELACIVPKPGKPKRCWILSELPRGVGFGRAALAMSSIFRIKPVLRNDDVLDMPVIVPIVFKLPPISKGTAPKQ